MSSLVVTLDKHMRYIVKNFQQQSNAVDCGVYAIAFAVSIAEEDKKRASTSQPPNDPSSLNFDVKNMRKHLEKCINDRKYTPFPTVQSREDRAGQKEFLASIDVLCFCRRTEFTTLDESDDWRYIQCENCKEWYHKMCVENFPKNLVPNWYCIKTSCASEENEKKEARANRKKRPSVKKR